MSSRARAGSGRPSDSFRARKRRQSVSSAIGRMRDKMCRHGEEGLQFICTSDLRIIWNNQLLKEIIGEELTDAQIRHIKKELLPFVSFLVWIRVEDWFDEFIPKIFPGQQEPGRIITLPTTVETLQSLGVPPNEAGLNTQMDDQYRFIPATIVLHPGEPIYTIPDRKVRLPFEARDPNALYGGYGKVEFSTIAGGHWRFKINGEKHDVSSPLVVAVKTFVVREDATDEVRNLQLLNSSLTHNDNISLPLALIEHGSAFMILFDKAAHGDLWQFLYSGHPPDDAGRQERQYSFEEKFPDACKEEAELSHAVLEQALHLSQALKFLHTPRLIQGASGKTFCAHMDLKPDNILIFQDDRPNRPVGMWKFCDFGISAFKDDERDDAAPHGSGGDFYALTTMRVLPKRSEGTYQAPEVHKIQPSGARGSEKDRRRVGRKGDIWSFGAILAELLSFVLNRDRYVKEFREKRVRNCQENPRNDFFFDSGLSPSQAQGFLVPEQPTQEFRLRPAVEDWLRLIARKASSPRRYIDCWAEVILKILDVDMVRRPDATALATMVEHVFRHMQWARQPEGKPCPYITDNAASRPTTANIRFRSGPSLPGTTFSTSRSRAQTQSMLSSSGLTEGEPSSEQEPEPHENPITIPEIRRISSEQGTSSHAPYITHMSPSFEPPSPSPSMILRHPVHAHGIKINPDIERTPGLSKCGKLDVKSAKTLSVDTSAIDRVDVAYLVGSTFCVYRICPPTLSTTVHLFSHSLTSPSKAKWAGVAIAGGFAAIWGKKSDDSAALNAARFSPDQYTSIQLPTDALRFFDYTKRVAVSCLGFIAMICGKRIAIANLTVNPPVIVFRQTHKSYPQLFGDVVFNDSGELLYAWANASAQERAGALFVYRVTDLERTQPESKGFYKYDTNYQRPTRLFPYNNYQGCIVAANQQLFYPAVIRAFNFDDRFNLPRHFSDLLKHVDVKAACMFNNHSLITVQKRILHYRLMEYPLDFTGDVHKLGEPQEICKLKSSIDASTEVRAVQQGSDIFIIVFTTGGQIEWIKFNGSGSRSPTGMS